MKDKVIKFPKNFCWETTGQLSELLKQAEHGFQYLKEDTVGYYYYWMWRTLKEIERNNQPKGQNDE